MLVYALTRIPFAPALFDILVAVFIMALPELYERHKDKLCRNLVFWCWQKQYSELASTVNKLLPCGYKLCTQEDASIRYLFREYQDWLIAQYIGKSLSSVYKSFRSYFSRRNRKLYHPENLAPYFGGVLKEDIFFLETVGLFLSLCNRDGEIGDMKLYDLAYKPENDTLTDIGIVAHKIILAAAIAQTTMGYHYDPQIDAYKKQIDKSRP